MRFKSKRGKFGPADAARPIFREVVEYPGAPGPAVRAPAVATEGIVLEDVPVPHDQRPAAAVAGRGAAAGIMHVAV